jgi:hypothetical protein
MRRNILSVLSLILVFTSGCITANLGGTQNTDQLVNVRIIGYVTHSGDHEIPADFTISSINNAAGIKEDPTFGRTRRFILYRKSPLQPEGKIEEKTPNSILFEDMPRLRAEGFKFENGDRIFIPRIIY